MVLWCFSVFRLCLACLPAPIVLCVLTVAIMTLLCCAILPSSCCIPACGEGGVWWGGSSTSLLISACEYSVSCFVFSVFSMSRSKCQFSRDGKSCHYEFSEDGHALCVPHRPCVSSDFVFDPDECTVCSENVKFLRMVGHVDRLSHQFTALKRSWDAVQRSAKRKGAAPSWRNPDLQEFVLGRGGRRSSQSAASSTSRSSSGSSLLDEPVAGPSSAPPAAPSAAGTSLPWMAGESLLPQLQEFLRGLVAEFTSSWRPSSPAASAPPASQDSPVPAASLAPSGELALVPLASQAPLASAASPAPLSALPASQAPPVPAASPVPSGDPAVVRTEVYEVEASPVSDGAPAAEATPALLGEEWTPFPHSWRVMRDKSSPESSQVIMRPRQGSDRGLEEVRGVQFR